jgi:hypothetical protein
VPVRKVIACGSKPGGARRSASHSSPAPLSTGSPTTPTRSSSRARATGPGPLALSSGQLSGEPILHLTSRSGQERAIGLVLHARVVARPRRDQPHARGARSVDRHACPSGGSRGCVIDKRRARSPGRAGSARGSHRSPSARQSAPLRGERQPAASSMGTFGSTRCWHSRLGPSFPGDPLGGVGGLEGWRSTSSSRRRRLR